MNLLINEPLSISRRCVPCSTSRTTGQRAAFNPTAKATILSFFAVCLWFSTTAGCGAGQTNVQRPAPGTDDAPNGIDSGDADTPPTAIAVEWEQDSCTFTLREGIGATYRFATLQQTRVQELLRGAIAQCSSGATKEKTATGGTTQPPLHGVVYIRGVVAPDGAVGQVQVSPSGTVSTTSAQCLRKAVASLRLGRPQDRSNVLLVTLVGACGKNWLTIEQH